MQIETKQDYLESLRKQKVNIYCMGEKVADRSAFPAFAPHINCAAKTYEMALQPEFEDLLTAKSHLTGARISRFTHIHRSVDDLIKKVQMLRAVAHETANNVRDMAKSRRVRGMVRPPMAAEQRWG